MSQNPYSSPENVPAEGRGQQPSPAPSWETSAAPSPTQDAWGPSAQQWSQSPASSAPAPSAPAAYANGQSATGPSTTAGAGSAVGTGTGSGSKGFFGSLFDFSFRHFVTIRFVQIFFIIGIAFAVLYYIVGFISAGIMGAGVSYYDDYSAWPVVLYLLFGWIAPVLMVLLLRVFLEFVVATIRTSQNTTEIVDHLKTRG